MQVKEVMSRRIIAISPEETVAVAARLLSQHNIGALPVCSRDGRLRGMVTDRDIVVRCVAAGDDPERTRVAEIMTRRVLAAEPDRSVDEAARLMAREQVRRLPVQERGRLVGMVSLGDVAVRPDYTMEAGEALQEISQNIRRV